MHAEKHDFADNFEIFLTFFLSEVLLNNNMYLILLEYQGKKLSLVQYLKQKTMIKISFLQKLISLEHKKS